MIDAQKVVLLEWDSPDPEVTPKAKRRIFNAPYKKKILAEVEAAVGTGSIDEILRREGIYSSTLTSWRKERDAAVNSVYSHKRAPELKRNPLTAENEKPRHQNQRLQEELRKARSSSTFKKTLMLRGAPSGMKRRALTPGSESED